MQLHEIRSRILLAEKNLEEINPSIKCYIVVSFHEIQFIPGNLSPGNLKLVDLMSHPGIFLPGQNLRKMVQIADKINQLKDEKPAKSENSKLIHDLFADFAPIIETLGFHDPQFELRFYSLDMEKIQELKAHPIVQRIGKTDMSAASVNVVIG
jgi:hypothetical protein